jgi:hypothetical protein
MPSKRPHNYRGPVILFRLIRSAAEAGHDWSVYLFNLEDRIPTDHLIRRITGFSSGGRRIRKRQQRVCLVSIAILGVRHDGDRRAFDGNCDRCGTDDETGSLREIIMQ